MTSSLLLAALLAAVQLDPGTGLWFPPYASRTQYLSRDPAHSLIADAQRAFKENPALGDEVCSSFIAAGEPQTAESHDPSVRQFRTMFAMMCMGRGAKARRDTEAADRMKSAISDLQAMFDQEERPLAAWKQDQREKRASELVQIIDDGSGPSLRPALQVIALMPNYTFGIHSLLALPDWRLTDGTRGVSHAQAAAFLEQLYRSRAANGWEWQAGLPAVLLFEGKLDDAKKAAEDWYAAAPREKASYARVMVAVIDRAMGREGALDRITAGCLPNASWKAANPDGDPGDYCRMSAAMLVINALDVMQEHAPKALAAGAFDLERLYFQDDWPYRLGLVAKAGFVDPAAAQKHFYAMLADPNIPGGAQLDAIYYLFKIAAVHDKPRVAPLVDCWIRLQEVNIPPATPGLWKQLMAMTAQGAHRQADCNTGAANTHCIMHALSMRLDAAMDTQQWNVARQTIEKMASIIVASGGNPLTVRTALMDLAQREAGSRRPEAVQIMSYLKSHPQDSYVTSELARFGDSVPPGAPQPWPSPAAAEVVDDCPPRG